MFLKRVNGTAAFVSTKVGKSGHSLRGSGKFSAEIFLSKRLLTSSGVFLINHLCVNLNTFLNKKQVFLQKNHFFQVPP